MTNYNQTTTSVQRFAAWFKKDPTHYLIRAWRMIVADYWYYEQTGHLAREHWRSELSIVHDIDVLLKASEVFLRSALRT
jgi:hypothetical protein